MFLTVEIFWGMKRIYYEKKQISLCDAILLITVLLSHFSLGNSVIYH